MGQNNQNILGNEQSLSKMFLLKGKSKQYNITYLEHLQDHKPYILREATYNIEREQQEAISKIKQRQHINSPHLTNLIRYETSKDEGLCSRYFRLLSLWEFPRKILAEENNERALSKQPYHLEQIRRLLIQISVGLHVLQKNRISHESLTSKTILVEQPLNFRVLDPICLSLHTNLQQIYHKRSLKNIYLSPEQCQLIDHQNINQVVADPYREDVFTAGMLVLQSGLLQRQDDCYVQDCARVNWQQVDINLNRFQQRYGPQLRNILGLMLTRQKAKRIDWQQLLRMLQNRSQIRVSQVPNNIQRVSLGTQPIRTVPIVQQNIPIITRTSYSPPVRSTIVPIVGQTVRNLSPNRVVRQLSPTRVVQVHQQPQMRGSYIFNYQNNSSQIAALDTSITRMSMPATNNHVIYQNRVSTVNHLHPLSFTSYKPAPSTLVQRVQITAKSPKPAPTTTHIEVQQSEFKINSPTILETNQKQVPSFELNQLQPVYVIEQFKNGSKYQGYKFKGKREGWGKYQYQEGGYYEGEWKNDLMSGKGKLYYESGKIAYDGHLEQDLFHGSGTLYNELPETLTTTFDYKNFEEIEEYWIKYEGQFRNDKKEGHGSLTLTNGQCFQGSFHDDKVQGEGVYRTVQGKEIRGIWHQNKLQRQL